MGIPNGILEGNTTYHLSGDFLGNLAASAAIIVSAILIGLAIRALMRRWLRPRLHQSVYKPLENIVFYTIIGAGAAAALTPFGIDTSLLLVTGGIAGIVIGIASQTVVSNLLSGFFLLAERPLKIGDHVSLGGYDGIVVDVNMFSTVIRTWDGVLVRIPNEKVFGDRIVNLTKTAARRVEFTVAIPYSASVEEARKTILEALNDYPYCLIRPRPEVYVKSLGDYGIELRVRCWTPTQTWFETRIALLEKIYTALQAAGINVPYPRMDVYVRELASAGGEEVYGTARGVGEAETVA